MAWYRVGNAGVRAEIQPCASKEKASMRRLFVTFVFVLAMTSGPASAAPAVKIGVVDLKRAVAECKEGVAVRATLLKKTEQLNAELKVMLADYEKMRVELEKGSANLSADARSEKELLLQKKARDYQNRQREDQEELKQMESSYLKKILSRLNVIIGEIGDERNFAVVLDRNTDVFYVGKEIDVTPLLIQRADEEFGKLQARNESK
jgi:outer membrane protein